MILVDTSVWVDHFRNNNARLAGLLADEQVLIHPYIIGELSLGSIKNRSEIIGLLAELPLAPVAEHEEVMDMVHKHKLFGCGIGWVDAHLIASALLAHARLLSNDKALLQAGKVTGVIAPHQQGER
jgi:predicted nucleic acid-binding protein